jgi:hypothetical protein
VGPGTPFVFLKLASPPRQTEQKSNSDLFEGEEVQKRTVAVTACHNRYRGNCGMVAAKIITLSEVRHFADERKEEAKGKKRLNLVFD